MPQRHILVVEDEGITALHLQDLLDQRGYEDVSTASSGEDALVLAQQNPPDLAMLDIKLAGQIDGLETGRRLRAIDPELRIIYITSYSQADMRAQAAETDPVGYLIKPITKDQLFSALDSAFPE